MKNKHQEKFGYPAERTQGKVKPCMAPWIQEFIRHSPFCVLATSSAQGDCDASPKGGKPGFAKVLNDKQLLIPDVAGNKLFHSYGNIEGNPRAGLIFFIPGHDSTVRVNGRVKVVEASELRNVSLEVHNPDEKAKVLQGLLVDVDEALQPLSPGVKVFQSLGYRADFAERRHPTRRRQGTRNLACCREGGISLAGC